MSGKFDWTPEFFKASTLIDENGCWIWQRNKGVGRFPYGVVSIDGKAKRAHRVSWQLFVGPIPDGMVICHKCDVPQCVNPDHLFVGTYADNMRDMWAKGRHPKVLYRDIGSPTAKLNWNAVAVIKKMLAKKVKQRAIAYLYGVHEGTISDIKRGLTWEDESCPSA